MPTDVQPGDIAGAVAYANSLTAGGKVPSSWLEKTQYGSNGAYSFVSIPAGGGQNGNARIYFHDATGKHNIIVDFDKSGKVLGQPHADNNASASFIEQLARILSPIPGSKIDPSGGQYDQGLVNAIAAPVNWSISLAKALSFLTDPSFWKRFGIGAAGVVILLLVFVAIMKRDVL